MADIDGLVPGPKSTICISTLHDLISFFFIDVILTVFARWFLEKSVVFVRCVRNVKPERGRYGLDQTLQRPASAVFAYSSGSQ